MAIADLLMRSMPLGFRFRPSDVELVDHYLKGKILGRLKAEDDVIAEIDVCKCEPWDLPDKSLIKLNDPEWFFFAPKDRKYPTGQRTNRATEAGYWKATGKDRLIKSRLPGQGSTLIGTKKTLVFHLGRAPKGTRTCWIMHEYRTTEPEYESGKEGGFVLCRLFKKLDDTIKASEIDECTEKDAQNGTETVAKFVQPLNQKLPKQEPLQSPPSTADAHPSQVNSSSEGDGECVTSYPSKTVEGSCSDALPSDNDVAGTEVESLLGDIASYMDQEYDKFSPADFHKVHSFGNSYMDYSFNEGFSEEFPLNLLQNNPTEHDTVNDFLDTLICEPEEFYHEESCVNVDSILSCVQDVTDSSSLDSVLGKESIARSDGSLEAAAVQYTGNLVDGGFGAPAFSNNASQANNYICCVNESYSQFAVLPTEYLSRRVSFVGADVDALLQEPGQAPKQVPASKATNVLNNVVTGTAQIQVNNNVAGVEVRTRQSLIGTENFIAQQGVASRRVRLQKVVKHDKGHDEKERSVPECISSNIKGESSSHADILTEKMKNVSPPKHDSGSKHVTRLVVLLLAVLFIVVAATRYSFS